MCLGTIGQAIVPELSYLMSSPFFLRGLMAFQQQERYGLEGNKKTSEKDILLGREHLTRNFLLLTPPALTHLSVIALLLTVLLCS